VLGQQQLQRFSAFSTVSAFSKARLLSAGFRHSIISNFKHLLGGKAALILPVFVGFAVVWGIREGRIDAFSKGAGGIKDNLLKQGVGEPVVGAPTSGGTNKHKMMSDCGTSPITAAGNALFRSVLRDVQMLGCIFKNSHFSINFWTVFNAELPAWLLQLSYVHVHIQICAIYVCAENLLLRRAT